MTTQADHDPSNPPLPHGQAHPQEALYVKVALALAAITAFEIAVSYLEWAAWVTITMLVGLSLVKFIAVVGYFMHLKFDHKALRKPFVTGLITALIVYTIVLLAFALHSNNPPTG